MFIDLFYGLEGRRRVYRRGVGSLSLFCRRDLELGWILRVYSGFLVVFRGGVVVVG